MAQSCKTLSEASVSSVGMGSGTAARPRDDDAIPQLLPEGNLSSTGQQPTFDCIVFLFYCQTHDKVAVTNAENSKVAWLPFVALPEGVTWEQASKDGMSILLSKRESESDEVSLPVDKLPKHEMTSLHMFLWQTSSDRFVSRLTQYVSFEPTPGSQCCQKTTKLDWVPAQDLMNDRVQLLWGPEPSLFIAMLANGDSKLIFDYSFEDALYYLRKERISYQHKLLSSHKINRDMITDLYEDYVHHCFPSFYMSFESYKAYLMRYGFQRNDVRLPKLFNACDSSNQRYIDFTQFMVGLLCMEPYVDNINCEARHRFLYRFYATQSSDPDNNRASLVLSIADLVVMFIASNPTIKPADIRAYVDKNQKTLGFVQGTLPFEVFSKLLKQNSIGYFKATTTLCRSPKSLVEAIRFAVKIRNEERMQPKADKTKVISQRRDRGSCNACRAQNYEYGLHCVYFDTNGRCVKPFRLRDVRFGTDDSTMTRARYSAEICFGIGSICSTFLDLTRDMYFRMDENKNLPQQTVLDDNIQFAKYIKNLCEHVNELLACEQKIIKINAPAIVIGDLCGNADCLFTLERLFWQSVPVLTSNLVFLGNYMGGATTGGVPGTSGTLTSFNIEIFCYLLALKMAAPSKVFLLRGVNETADHIGDDLMAECVLKYGQETGKYLFNTLIEVMNQLPFAMVIDETILCTHSGIPRGAAKLAKFLEIPNSVSNVAKESPFAYELILNVPNEKETSNSSKRLYGMHEFTSNIFESFMKSNQLAFFIRSHLVNTEDREVQKSYQGHFNGRCLTVTTNDNQTSNGSGCVAMVDATNELVRLVKFTKAKRAELAQTNPTNNK